MRYRIRLVLILLLLGCGGAFCQEQSESLDGPRNIFRDELLDKLVGQWKLSGKIRGKPAEQTLDVEWTLNHQFLRLHEVGLGTVNEGQIRYEALVFIGYDNASERYVAHWIDVYGGRFSETLGYGARSGKSVRFVFEYPDGPFHTAFVWKPETNSWQVVMETKGAKGKWVNFADLAASKQ